MTCVLQTRCEWPLSDKQINKFAVCQVYTLWLCKMFSKLNVCTDDIQLLSLCFESVNVCSKMLCLAHNIQK